MAKWALITGASAGLGKEIAKVLSNRGYGVVLVARRLDKLQELKNELPGEVLVLEADLTQDDSDEVIYKFCEDNGVEISTLVNNAGFGDYNAFLKSEENVLKNMIKVNCLALTSLTRKFAEHMAKNGGGNILNIASIAGFFPGPYMATYYATKAFVISLSEAIRVEFKRLNVKVTTICPGPIRTEFQIVAGAKGMKFLNNPKIPSAEKIARFSCDMMEAGKGLCITDSFLGIGISFMTRFLPRSLSLFIINKIQESKEKRYNT